MPSCACIEHQTDCATYDFAGKISNFASVTAGDTATAVLLPFRRSRLNLFNIETCVLTQPKLNRFNPIMEEPVSTIHQKRVSSSFKKNTNVFRDLTKTDQRALYSGQSFCEEVRDLSYIKRYRDFDRKKRGAGICAALIKDGSFLSSRSTP
jgi:hypothetical protein